MAALEIVESRFNYSEDLGNRMGKDIREGKVDSSGVLLIEL